MAYTRKQQAALARATPAQRVQMRALFDRQKANGNGGNSQRASRAMAERVLAPGAGKAPSRPFGSSPSYGLKCWDAFHTSHAPLPRSVGPYAVVRTTRIFTSTSKVNVFGVAVDNDGSWSSTVCWSSVTPGSAINAASNTKLTRVQPPGVTTGQTSTFSAVPAALSVQVMNVGALQTTSGLVVAAVCPTQLSLVDNTRTWDDLSAQLATYMKPRLMSAPKLALRGVQMNSYPLNMSSYSNFEQITDYADGNVTWDSSTGGSSSQYLTGLAPIVVVNEDSASLTYSVCVEWRVRFDMSNPAVASHTHHGITPDRIWDGMVRGAQALGNGVQDIAEVVANTGYAIGVVRHALRGGSRPLPMLVD